MNFSDPDDRAAFAKANGFDVQSRSEAYAPLREDLRRMVIDKLRQAQWVPREAIAAVAALPQTQFGATLVAIPLPTTKPDGSPSPFRPAWLDTAQKRMVWDEFAATFKQAEQAFNANQVAIGRQVMARAYADTAFWDRAIAVARFLATPVRIAEHGASMFLESNVFKIGVLVAIVYGAVVMARRKGKS